MKTLLSKLGVIQNVGLADRVIRVIIGAFMLIGVMVYIQRTGVIVDSEAYVALLSIYPLLSGILGWDPLYAMTQVRTCRMTGRNQCGTLPYQVDAAMGHRPMPNHEYDHSLAGSHH